MECECGGLLAKAINPESSKDDIKYCVSCFRVWRLDYVDPLTQNCVLVDYEAELAEKKNNIQDS